MIIVRISEGMGNQLFQYALGRALSSKNGDKLKFETSYFETGTRKYSLGRFNIPESQSGITEESDFRNIGVPGVSDKSPSARVRRKIFRIAEYFKPICNKKFILEPYFHFCPDILNIKGSAFLSGVWQSEKYFKNSESTIRKELTLREPPSIETQDWVKKVESCNSISLHVRRGDYIENRKANQFHGVCTPEYYEHALEFVSKKIPHPVFFIFSDDILWARNNLKIHNPVWYVSSETLPDYEELMIMSKCKHNIIANSSFSWWGAWLNNNTEKVVIAPQKWFNSNTASPADLIPDSWIKI